MATEQELQEQVTTLKRKNKELEKKVKELEERIKSLKAFVNGENAK